MEKEKAPEREHRKRENTTYTFADIAKSSTENFMQRISQEAEKANCDKPQ